MEVDHESVKQDDQQEEYPRDDEVHLPPGLDKGWQAFGFRILHGVGFSHFDSVASRGTGQTLFSKNRTLFGKTGGFED